MQGNHNISRFKIYGWICLIIIILAEILLI